MALRKRDQSSDLAADEVTHLQMVERASTAPFSLMGKPSFGRDTRKKWAPARLCACGAVRYEASECTLSIMLLAWYQIFASGFVAM